MSQERRFTFTVQGPPVQFDLSETDFVAYLARSGWVRADSGHTGRIGFAKDDDLVSFPDRIWPESRDWAETTEFVEWFTRRFTSKEIPTLYDLLRDVDSAASLRRRIIAWLADGSEDRVDYIAKGLHDPVEKVQAALDGLLAEKLVDVGGGSKLWRLTYQADDDDE